MNREIKFRVWDNVDFMSNPFTLRELQIGRMQFSSDSVVMQYTGLKDNIGEEGQEIYEGDIIEFIFGDRYVVEWNDDTCKFQFSDGSDINDGLRYASHKVIVGNIYENPELIK